MNDLKTYVFFGNVGAGKGTQITLLKKDLLEKTGKESVYVSPGEEFRAFVSGSGYTNTLAKKILDRGNLLPVFLVSYVLANALTKAMTDGDKHMILDGFPRSVEQISIFESVVKFYERKNIEIIYIKISKEESVKRLMLRGRHDDTEEGLANRFGEYEKNVIPALELLKEKGYSIIEINGEQDVENVHEEIISKVFGA